VTLTNLEEKWDPILLILVIMADITVCGIEGLKMREMRKKNILDNQFILCNSSRNINRKYIIFYYV